jgi:hypothetical protein
MPPGETPDGWRAGRPRAYAAVSGRPARKRRHVSCRRNAVAYMPPGETPDGWRAGRPRA